jgi:hypothetical protein
MTFLVEIDHVKSGVMPTPETGRAFIEQIILPTLSRGEQLVSERKIVAGGPVVGRIALRLVVEADSTADVDRLVSSLPLWTLAETRVIALTGFGDRRAHVQELLVALAPTTK